MTEKIYEAEVPEKQIVKGFELPNNRRQIGQPGGTEPEVFVEDYAFTFAKGLAEKEYTGCVVGVLVGESIQTEQGQKILIEGVVGVKDAIKRDVVCFTEENWTQIYRDIREHFPKLRIVGWFLGGPEFLLEDEERQKKIHLDYFGADKIMLKIDAMEGEGNFLCFREGKQLCLPGYYIYYEKNISMQNYMLSERQEEKPVYRDAPAKYVRMQRVVPEAGDSKERQQRLPENLYSLFYATGGVLCLLAVFVIGALAIQLNEREQLRKLLNEQEVSASATRQIYEVKEGETIEEICKEIYGDEELAKEIRLLNGLSDGENPKGGQKIFLP